ncbi:MAG TPA: hypothetical protein VMG35_16775 [Bryobacteraceae bacterium]|nr:hypothetical protein [Bryobacteraceae bacterium]
MQSGLSRAAALLLGVCLSVPGQVIEFESNGLKYQTVTKRGVTVMVARLPGHVREFSILQVDVSNGSAGPYTIRPEDFSYRRDDGSEMHAWPARDVVQLLKEKGGRSDVIKLVSAYEAALYGIPHMRVANAYEARRQAALAEVNSTKLKAAAAASAIALVQTKLLPGESTDGAVFFGAEGKPLPPGHLIVRTNTDVFDFQSE